MRAFRSALKGSTGNDVHFRIRSKDKGVLWVEMSWQPIYDAQSAMMAGDFQRVADRSDPEEHRQAIERHAIALYYSGLAGRGAMPQVQSSPDSRRYC